MIMRLPSIHCAPDPVNVEAADVEAVEAVRVRFSLAGKPKWVFQVGIPTDRSALLDSGPVPLNPP